MLHYLKTCLILIKCCTITRTTFNEALISLLLPKFVLNIGCSNFLVEQIELNILFIYLKSILKQFSFVLGTRGFVLRAFGCGIILKRYE